MARDDGKDKPSAPQVSVAVVAYQSGELLARCLAAVDGQTTPDVELVLVDNASDDGAAEAEAAARPEATFIRNRENRGFAAAVNQAAQAARGRWLALLNPDVFAEPDWLAELLAAAKAHPDVRCFASRQLMAEDPTVLDGLGDVMSASGLAYRGGYLRRDPGGAVAGEVFSACGGAMMIDRALFLEMGGLDERLFCYCEDVDLGYRLRLRGEATVLAPKAVVRHVGSASSGGPRSDFAVFHGTRNRVWVYLKNTPPLLLAMTLPYHLAITALLFASHAKRRELRAPLRGLAAAIRGLPLALRMRREAQAGRTATSCDIARMMVWSPAALVRRDPLVRPLRAPPAPIR